MRTRGSKGGFRGGRDQNSPGGDGSKRLCSRLSSAWLSEVQDAPAGEAEGASPALSLRPCRPSPPVSPGLCSPMMMVQALSSPISFLSATRSEAPGPGPGPGEGEGAGPGFARPLGCWLWPVMSPSRRVAAPCAAPSVRPAASPSIRQSVRALAAPAARTAPTDGRMRWRQARAPGPRAGRAGEGRKESGPAPPPPRPLKETPLPPVRAWKGRRRLRADLGRTSQLSEGKGPPVV